MSTAELWTKALSLDLTPETRQRLKTDVCVVGAGIAGLSTAYWLRKAGKDAVVIDPAPIRGGQTRVTTAHLSSVIDDRFFELERIHGEEGSRLAAQSHSRAINAIEDIIHAEQIDCDFQRVDGYLIAGSLIAGSADDPDSDSLEKEFEAARRTNALKVERLAKAPLARFDSGPCLRFAHQARFHPIQYLQGLASACQRRGARFVFDRAKEMEGGATARVVGESGVEIHCEAIVVATNSPVNNLFALHTKMAPYRTFAIGVEAPEEAMPDALLWDMEDPYHYVRRAASAGPDASTIIVGGEDYKTAHEQDDEARFARLHEWARERFGAGGEMKYRWSGQVMETIDGLAFIGRNPADHDNVFVIAGDSGMGLTHGSLGGEIVSDLILRRENPFAELYSPSRKPLAALPSFLEENLDVAAQYAAWATAGDVGSEQEIAPGQGAVLRRGLKKIAVFRDPQGELHECSAVCPHLGCIVGWNPTSESWDCPCHGSRFSALGEVVQGPAVSGLAQLEKDLSK